LNRIELNLIHFFNLAQNIIIFIHLLMHFNTVIFNCYRTEIEVVGEF